MNLEQRLEALQRQVAQQVNGKVDLYYYEGYGALFIRSGFPLHPNFVIFAFPDIAIRQNLR